VEFLLYGAIVLLGSVLIVLTSLNQPYNQNEWKQVSPYDESDLGAAVSGTRQPPLDPLLGTLVQRLVGEGHLEQRLVPMVSGVGSLLLMLMVLRRLQTGYAGVVALAIMATAPVFLRFSAYARPYALPMMLMLVCVVAGTCWLDTGRRRWLAAAVGGALALPLARVPEPTVFLAASALVLAVAGQRSSLPRVRAWLLSGALLVSLVTTGLASSLALAQKTGESGSSDALLDLSPSRAVGRLPEGLREMWDHVLPLLALWFPWWPLVLLVAVLGASLPAVRRRLLGTWYWVPMVLAPLVFLVAYHTVNAYPLEMRHYQIRFASFWVPPLVVMVALVVDGLSRGVRPRRALAPLLAVALVAGQLPGTWRVLTENDAVDFAQAGEVLDDRVAGGGIVIYDAAARAGYWRQPFSGRGYLPEDVELVQARSIARGRVRLPPRAPVHLLLLDSDCASATACDVPGLTWDGRVSGYERVARFDRFTLYRPTAGQHGRSGAVEVLLSLVDAFGEKWAVTNAAAAARLLEVRGQPERAARLVRRVCDRASEAEAAACRQEIGEFGLGELLTRPSR
jgi:hypothetical protein